MLLIHFLSKNVLNEKAVFYVRRADEHSGACLKTSANADLVLGGRSVMTRKKSRGTPLNESD